LNYATIKFTDFADGPGVRVALYVSGCQKALDGNPCPGCHNMLAWNKEYGNLFTKKIKQQIFDALEQPYISGFSLLGGEPLSIFNLEEETKLLKEIKKRFPNKTVWMWTGYYYEDWIKEHGQHKIFKYIDYLVDGPYVERYKNLKLKFRGSSNQRIIRFKKGRLAEFIDPDTL
jgi:anaerobic ribonucleoside-triphosphate reductase activating protein